MRRAARSWSIGVALLAIAAAAGCSSPPAGTLPAGVAIDVYQSRIDYSEHKLEVALRNDSAMPVEVLALSFSSPAFPPSVDYERAPTVVRPGTTTDFRLLLPPADCRAEDPDPRVVVRFSFDGQERTVTMRPDDRLGQLPTVVAEDCRGQAVAGVASIFVGDTLRYGVVDGRRAVLVDVLATPTGEGGTLRIDDVRGTVLLDLLDPETGAVGTTVPLGLDLGAADRPVRFTLTLVAARCDPHVVLEDKRGTFFPLTVTTQRDTGRIYLGVSDAQRSELYDFVGESCGWS